ncbi:hypothetical protein NJLHNGOC_13305 [Novacetimonas cocois]|uniref:Uncharacterized protein n=1 Tax=Novacetimonas cocois TaxID=1747507 RepID=A0A365YRL6_9PROT|nr:hypothetical protein NJLHNGOC_13305 [Novacetimonas cocois]
MVKLFAKSFERHHLFEKRRHSELLSFLSPAHIHALTQGPGGSFTKGQPCIHAMERPLSGRHGGSPPGCHTTQEAVSWRAGPIPVPPPRKSRPIGHGCRAAGSWQRRPSRWGA